MDIRNLVNNLYHEQAGLKQKYETVISLYGEVIEALKKEEMKLMNRNRVKSQRRCRFYNRGFCRESPACPLFHPSENHQEFCTSGFCSRHEMESCLQRHFNVNTGAKEIVGERKAAFTFTRKKAKASDSDEGISILNYEDLKNPQKMTNNKISARDANTNFEWI